MTSLDAERLFARVTLPSGTFGGTDYSGAVLEFRTESSGLVPVVAAQQVLVAMGATANVRKADALGHLRRVFGVSFNPTTNAAGEYALTSRQVLKFFIEGFKCTPARRISLVQALEPHLSTRSRPRARARRSLGCSSSSLAQC